MKQVKVHGFMFYKCECGAVFRMWCEEGIEEGGKNHKPSPFVIRHTCGRFAKDTGFLYSVKNQRRLRLDAGYMTLPDGESYFANRKKSECGVPIFNEKVRV